jgi:hypothetical protein
MEANLPLPFVTIAVFDDGCKFATFARKILSGFSSGRHINKKLQGPHRTLGSLLPAKTQRTIAAAQARARIINPVL